MSLYAAIPGPQDNWGRRQVGECLRDSKKPPTACGELLSVPVQWPVSLGVGQSGD